jgi:hypothetical protein
MHFFQLDEIARALNGIERDLDNSSNNLLQWITVIVAFFIGISSPIFAEHLRRRPKESKLNAVDTDIKKQINDGAVFNDGWALLNMGRLIVRNDGKFIAGRVEAYLDRIEDNGKCRENFFPIPLKWTHGQLSASGSPTVRDIYPGQTVYLDVYKEEYKQRPVALSRVSIDLAAGGDIKDFSELPKGRSVLFIKIYQESGQVDNVSLEIKWDGIKSEISKC